MNIFTMSPECIYDLLEEKRRVLGLSQADVGLRAFGKPSNEAMQSLRRGNAPSFQRLQALASALEMVVAIMPKEEAAKPATDWPGFAESQVLIEGRPEALMDGYAPIPYLEEAGGGTLNVSPVAVSRAWAEQSELDFDQLCVVKVHPTQVTDDIQEGDRLIVDQRPSPQINGRLFVYFSSMLTEAEVARIEEITPGSHVAIRDRPDSGRVRPLPHSTRIIGPVVGLVRFSTW